MTNVFWLDHERDRMLEQVEARADVARAAGGAAIQSVSPPATDPFPPLRPQEYAPGMFRSWWHAAPYIAAGLAAWGGIGWLVVQLFQWVM